MDSDLIKIGNSAKEKALYTPIPKSGMHFPSLSLWASALDLVMTTALWHSDLNPDVALHSSGV